MVPKDYLFSSEAVIDQNRSDSDLISLLNILHYSLGKNCRQKNNFSSYIDGELIDVLSYVGFDNDFINFKSEFQLKKRYDKIKENCVHINQLINDYQSHQYLKPWWKTHSEFENFLATNFKDDRVRAKLCAWISQGENKIVNSQEFRSQLAKNVIYITQRLKKEREKSSRLLYPLETGDFFVIQRSARFFDPETISGLDIALKCNEVLGTPRGVKYRSGEFYIKTLDKVIPQRDYYSMYAKDSFYIFSKRLPENSKFNSKKRTDHYRQIEQIFVFVAETLIRDGARKFQQNYSNPEKELSAHKDMYERFKNNIVSEA